MSYLVADVYHILCSVCLCSKYISEFEGVIIYNTSEQPEEVELSLPSAASCPHTHAQLLPRTAKPIPAYPQQPYGVPQKYHTSTQKSQKSDSSIHVPVQLGRTDRVAMVCQHVDAGFHSP